MTAAILAVWAAGYRIQVIQSARLAPEIPNNSLVFFGDVSIDKIHRGDVIAFVGPKASPGMVVQRVMESAGVGLKAVAYTSNGPERDNLFPVTAERLRGRAAFAIPHSAFAGRALASQWATPALSAITVVTWLAGIVRDHLRKRREV